MKTASLQDRYFVLLRNHLVTPQEANLAEAAQLGRELVTANIPPEDIAQLHEEATKCLAETFPEMTLREAADLVSAPLMEMLMAYGLAFRELLEERIRAEVAREAHVEQLNTLNLLSRKIGSSLHLAEVLDFIVHSTAELLDVPHVVIFTLEDRTLTFRARHGNWLRGESIVNFAVGQGGAGRVAETGAPLYIKEVLKDPEWMHKDWAKENGIGSYLGVPLKRGQQVTGVLGCMTRGVRSFSKDEVELTETFAHGAAIAIQNARLHEAAIGQVAELESLRKATKALTSELDLSKVLERIAAEGTQLLGANRCLVYKETGNAEAPQILYSRGLSGAYLELLEKSYDRTLLAAALTGGGPVAIGDASRDSRYPFPAEIAAAEGFRSILVCPLIHQEARLGVLSFYWDERRELPPSKVALAQIFADQAAIAIKNAEVHSRLEASFENLERGQAMIVRAEKLSSLGILTAGAAHEILNPANIIRLHGQRLLWESEAGAPGRQSAEVILRNVDRITRICDDLRRYSRDEPPQREPFDPNEPIRDCLRPLEPVLRLSNIETQLKLSENGQAVTGDRSQLQQVFMNLFENAIDAMPEGGTLSVSSQKILEEGVRWWEVQVANTGPDIPEEILPKIFDPFFTTKPEDKGTGLGLAVSSGIVESHGGKLWVKSAPGQGATFILRLPVMEEKA